MPDTEDRLIAMFGGGSTGGAVASPASLPAEDRLINLFGMGMTDTEYVEKSQAAGLSVGRSAEEQADILRKRGLSDRQIQPIMQNYKLEHEYRNLGRFEGGKETIAGSMLHQAREHFIPFRSWVVNPEQGEHEATARFQQGAATDDDIKLLARARRKQEDEQKLHETVAGQVIAAARDAPAIMGEYMAGAGILAKTGILQANRVSTVGNVFAGSGRTALLTAAMPSMYMADARQKNMAAGRDPNDWRGLPSAGLHAFAQMMVLGKVFQQAGTPTGAGLVGGIKASAGAGLKGGVEMVLADSATHFADLFIPEAYKISSGEGTFEHLLKGDVSAAARKFAVDATTLAMFAGIHRMADGLSPPEAAVKAKEALDQVRNLPPEVIADVKADLKANPKDTRPLQDRLADAIVRVKQALLPELKTPEQVAADKGIQKTLESSPELAAMVEAKQAYARAAQEVGRRMPRLVTPEQLLVEQATGHFEGGKVAGKRAVEESTPAEMAPESPVARPGEEAAIVPDKAGIVEPAKPAEAVAEPVASQPPEAASPRSGQPRDIEVETRAESPEPNKARAVLETIVRDAPGIKKAEADAILSLMSGASSRAAAKGVSHQTVLDRADKAFRALQKQYPEAFGQHESAQELVRWMKSERRAAVPAVDPAQASAVSSKFDRPDLMEVQKLAADSLARNKTLTPEQKAGFQGEVNDAFGRMTQAGRDGISQNLKGMEFYATPTAAVEGGIKSMISRADPARRAMLEEELANVQSGKVKAAAMVDENGVLHIDGTAGLQKIGGRFGEAAELSAFELALHEFGHVLDGPNKVISGSQAWRDIHKRELGIQATLKNGGVSPLTDYAVKYPSEAFAELLRVANGGRVDLAVLEATLPESVAFVKNLGLWPESSVGKAAKANEVFNTRVGDPEAVAHIDMTVERPNPAVDLMKLPTVAEAKDRLWKAAEWINGSLTRQKNAIPGVTLDSKNILPRVQGNNWEQLKEIASDPQGVGRIPGFNWLFDPGRTDATPEGKVFVGHQALKETGKDVAAMWAVHDKVSDSLFGADPATGEYVRGNGTKGRMADDIEAEMKKPGSQEYMSAEQRAFVHDVWTPLYKDAVAMMKENGMTHWENDVGQRVKINESAYFPRTVIGKKGLDVEAGPSRGERLYESEAEGSGTTIYDPSAKSRIAKFIAGRYSAVANHYLATDAALKGKTPKQRYDEALSENDAVLKSLDAAGRKELETELWDRANHPLLGREAFVQASTAFRGKIYPKEIADKIEGMFKQESSDWLKKVEKFSAAAKGVTLGGDFSYAFIQLLPTMFRNPVKWAKAMREGVSSIFDPTRLSKYLTVPENAVAARDLSQLGSGVGQLRDFMSGLSKGEFASKIPVLGKLYESTGRAFGTAMDVARIELWKAWKPAAKPHEYRALAEAIDSMLLSGRMEGIGLSPRRVMSERLLMLAPSYYRGGLQLMATAFQRGVAGDLARQALGATMGGILISSVAAMKAMGLGDDEVEERLNPARGKFLKVPVDLGDKQKVEVGYGNILTSYVRLLGAGADHFGSDRPIDTGADGNPILRWMRGKAATSPRLMIDLWTGKDYLGERQQPQESLLKAFEPLAIQQILHGDHSVFEHGAFDPQAPARTNMADALISVFGLASYPGSDADKRMAVYQQESLNRFNKGFSDLTMHQQAAVIKAAKASPDMPPAKPATPEVMERAFALQQERSRAILNVMGKDAEKKLTALGETIPVPSASIHLNGVDVPLSRSVMQKYQESLAVEYKKVVERWDVSAMKGMGLEQRKKLIENQFRRATIQAKNKMIGG